MLAELYARHVLDPPRDTALNLVNRDAPYLYSLNPQHSEISSQGLRDREYAVPKPEGTFRILVLGDSVTYGLFVPRRSTYPERLEKLLEKSKNVEVLNAGVNGYNPYNQLHLYREKLKDFDPDLVLAGFCMNDIADPVLHWRDKKGFFKDLESGAFPDYERHQKEVNPRVYRASSVAVSLLENSALYRALSRQWTLFRQRALRYESIGGRQWPVYVADEDPVSIRKLTDPETKEWKWLSKQYRDLRKEVKESGAAFAVILFPLAYQLDPDYPYFPQRVFLEFCRKENIACYDPLDLFRRHEDEKIFLGRHRYHPRDIWHLTEKGHRLTAEGLKEFLEKKALLPRE